MNQHCNTHLRLFLANTAYPLPEALQMVTITAVAGRDAVLPPLISPGALILQYFIDWQNATSSVTLARIQGPRSQMTFVPNERYSVSPDTFALTINSVRFEDRGSYLGVIGAREPTSGGQGQTFTQSQTLTESVTLEVICKFIAPGVFSVYARVYGEE